MINKFLLSILFCIILVIFFTFPVFAASDYVLPYPSFMPGTIFYKLHVFFEIAEQYWYFGDFGQFVYNLKESDKYLVEAKTLFEYKQYVLAINALRKSNTYFISASYFLNAAQVNGKNISQKKLEFNQAGIKHIEVLTDIKTKVPQVFLWQPEKKPSITLHIWNLIDDAMHVREKSK